MNKNKFSIQVAIENNPCSLCRAFGLPICNGHAPAAGGGSPGGSSHSNANDSQNKSSKSNNVSSQSHVASTVTGKDWSRVLTQHNVSFNFEKLNALLTIDNHQDGKLTLRPRPGLSKEEIELLKEFLSTVQLEFTTFKNQLAAQGLSVKNFTATLKDNTLIIHIPDTKHYNDFISQLLKKVFTAPISPKELKQTEEIVDKRNRSLPNPFNISKGPKPKGSME